MEEKFFEKDNNLNLSKEEEKSDKKNIKSRKMKYYGHDTNNEDYINKDDKNNKKQIEDEREEIRNENNLYNSKYKNKNIIDQNENKIAEAEITLENKGMSIREKVFIK